MTIYRLGYGIIQKLEVEKETEHFIFYRSKYYNKLRREKKDQYVFHTFAEAKQAAIDHAKQRIANAEHTLAVAKTDLEKSINLTEEALSNGN